jgi:hypothetical protein
LADSKTGHIRGGGLYILGLTRTWMQVIHDAQAPTASSGRMSLGRILPCICRKMGHFECFWMSRGPVWRGSAGAHTERSRGRWATAYEIIVNVQRSILAAEGVWREEPRRCQ